MSNWYFADATNTVVSRVNAGGGIESMLASALPAGTTVLPYVEPPLTPEQQLAAAKTQRAALVDAITVTTASGRVFDGNEDAQNRMSRAINGMDDTDTIPWVLNDNTVAMVGKAELREALRLSGAAMTAIWVTPYTPQP